MNKPRVLQTARKEEELPCERSLKTLKSKAADHVAKTAKQLKEANKTMMAPLERRKLRLQELEITQDTAARVRHQRSWAQHPNRTVEAGRREFEFAAAGQGEARRAGTKLSWGKSNKKDGKKSYADMEKVEKRVEHHAFRKHHEQLPSMFVI